MDILCERGTIFYWKSKDKKSKKELYKIEGLTSKPGILVEGVVRNESDAVAPITTLEGDQLLYVFGEAIGNVVITGTILLGSFKGSGSGFSAGSGEEGTELLGVVTDWFSKNRVSSLEDSVQISIADTGAFECFITGLVVEKPNAAVQTIPFTITGIAGSE